jgi:hypothetical protein
MKMMAVPPHEGSVRRIRDLGTSWVLACLLALPGCGVRSSEKPEDDAPIRAKSLAEALSTAQPGDTIVLPAGTYEGGQVLPSGVSLRGAGLGRTILDARKAEVGLAILGGRGVEVSDLTVRGAVRTGLLVSNAVNVAVRRVRVTASTSGVVFSNVAEGRIENAVSDGNRDGIILNGGRDNVVINCTLARDVHRGLSIASGERAVAFNNCLADVGIGVSLGAAAKGARLDYNLYAAPLVGEIEETSGRKSLSEWHDLSGQDAHSVISGVTFRDPLAGDYRPSGRGATADRGTSELDGIKAPEHDADDAPRVIPFDIGAYEASAP